MISDEKAKLLARSRQRVVESRGTIIAARRESDASSSWLSNIKVELSRECAASHEGVEMSQKALRELNKFADDEWGTMASELEHIGVNLNGRKRKLAQSLSLIMNTQDATPGFMALPPLPPTISEIATRRVELAKKSKDGGGLSRMDSETAELAIEEFTLRIRALDDVKSRIGENEETEKRSKIKQQRREAEAALDAIRARLNHKGRFQLYTFEEDELRRVSAYKRWRLWLNVITATIRLQQPLRKHAAIRRKWKRAVHVAAASNRFKRHGGERAQKMLDYLAENGGDDTGSSDEDNLNSGDKSKDAAGKSGASTPKGAGTNNKSTLGADLKIKLYSANQAARVRWRRCFGAAKCVARMRNNARYASLDDDDDDYDAVLEFKFTEKKIETLEKVTGRKKFIECTATHLINVTSGKLKAVAISSWHFDKQKRERDELMFKEPSGPGAANLLYTAMQRPDVDPKAEAAQREAEEEAKRQAELLALEEEQRLAREQLQQETGGSDGTTFFTAEEFQEMERKKQEALELAAEQEKLRMEEEENNFKYHGNQQEGLSWDDLHAPIIGASKKDEFGVIDDIEPIVSPFAIAPEDELQFAVWEYVRSNRFEMLVLLMIFANCVQLALYDPLNDNSSSGTNIFFPPFTVYKIFEIAFFIIFPTECILKLYAYRWVYFEDTFNRIDFFCVLLIFVDLLPNLPNLTVLRIARMIKPLRSIPHLPSLKVVVSTLTDASHDIFDVQVIFFIISLIFAVLCMDLFGGAFAGTCIKPVYSCSEHANLTSDYSACEVSGGISTLVQVERQPSNFTYPIVRRSCGVYDCADGYECYLGHLDTENPEGGALNFDHLGASFVSIFVVISRRGWVGILNRLWDTYGLILPTAIVMIVVIFGSYLLTNLVTAVIAQHYENANEEMVATRKKRQEELRRNRARRRAEGEHVSSSDEDVAKDEYGDEIVKENKYQKALDEIANAKKKAEKSARNSGGSIIASSIDPVNTGQVVGPTTERQRSNSLDREPPRSEPIEAGPTVESLPPETTGGAPGEAITDSLLELKDRSSSSPHATSGPPTKRPSKAAQRRASRRASRRKSNPQITKHGSPPQHNSIFNILVRRYCSKRPSWAHWRGIPFLRKVTRRIQFDLFFGLLIALNTYAVTISDVHTHSCMFKYSSPSQENSLEIAALAIARSDASTEEFTQDGDCIRGAYYRTDKSDYIFFESINRMCSLLFATEIMLRFMAEGFRYFENSYNLFDAIVVVLALLSIIVPLPGISSLRIFRLASLLSKSSRFESLKLIIGSIVSSIKPLLSAVLLLSLFIFIFAVGGLQIFGTNLPGHDRLNFRDFPSSLLTVFIMFTGDDWSSVMYKVASEEGRTSMLFFLCFIIFGTLTLSMLPLAVLLSTFNCGDKEMCTMAAVFPVADFAEDFSKWAKMTILYFTEGSSKARKKKERMLADLRRRGLAPEEEKPEDETKETVEMVPDKKNNGKIIDQTEKDIPPAKTKRQLEFEATKDDYFIQSHMTVLSDHPALILKRSADEAHETIRIENAPVELNGPIGYGYCKIEPGGSLHETVTSVVDNHYFEAFILLCIICSCGMLIYEGPGLPENSPLAGPFYALEITFMAIFVLECILRILAKGLIFTNTGYLRDPWNQLDFMVVVLDVMTTIFSSIGLAPGRFRALRSFRALRPLRTLKRAPELRAVVEIFSQCIPVVINLGICTAVFYFVFGVLHMSLFAGRFWRCNDPSIRYAQDCGGFFIEDTRNARFQDFDDFGDYDWSEARYTFKKQWQQMSVNGTSVIQRHWYNAPRDFDTISNAMLTVFEMATLDRWTEVLFQVMDAPAHPGEQSLTKGQNWGYAFFVVFVVIVSNYFLMNLFVCGVVAVNEQLHSNSSVDPDIPLGQRELIDVVTLMYRTRPGFQQIPPDPEEAGALKMFCWNVVAFDLNGKGRGTTFELIVSLLVVLNTVVLSCGYFQSPAEGEWIRLSDQDALDELQDTAWRRGLKTVNDMFSVIFLIEVLVKLVAFGLVNYWRDNWNRFDFFVVMTGLLQTFLDGFMGITIIPAETTASLAEVVFFDPKSLRVLRVFRLVRVVRLLKGLSDFERIQSIAHLVDTLQNCFHGVVHVLVLWLVVTISFALMGVAFYGETAYVYSNSNSTLPLEEIGNSTNTSLVDDSVLAGDNRRLVSESNSTLEENITTLSLGFVHSENYYGAIGEYAHFNGFGDAMVTMFKVATLDGWCWIMRDVMFMQRQRGEYANAWMFFILYLTISAFMTLNIFAVIFLDQYSFTARVTSKPRSNGLPRQILTFHQASHVSEEWSYMDPQKTGFIDASKVRQLLFNIGPPVGFAPDLNKARQVRFLRRMELRMTGRSQQVNYVDFFLSCAVLRYRMQRKPTAELDLSKIRGKLSLKVALAFPSIDDPRLNDTDGLLAAVQALSCLQGHYLGLILRRMRAKGDFEGIKNFEANRGKQIQQQLERQRIEAAEEAARAARLKAGASNSKKKGKRRASNN